MHRLMTLFGGSQIDHANQIIPRLWLGDYESSQDKNFIAKNKISVIINCTKDLPFVSIDKIYKYRVPVHDNLQHEELTSMIYWIGRIVPLLDQHYQSDRTILVHCAAGMQRSAIVVLSYLYQYVTHDASQALSLIKSNRPIAFTPYMNFKPSFCQKFGETACQQLSKKSRETNNVIYRRRKS